MKDSRVEYKLFIYFLDFKSFSSRDLGGYWLVVFYCDYRLILVVL